MNLYIIGNGFDKAHGLNTDYVDFKSYLYSIDENCYYKCRNLIIKYAKIHNVSLNLESLWRSFEENLACVNIMRLPVDHELDVIPKLRKYFLQWVKNIEEKCFTKTEFLDTDYFLTFNYTEVLEKQYKINPEQVCHIHGNKTKPFFGGNVIGTTSACDFDNERIKRAIEQANEKISLIYKNSAERLNENMGFFNKIAKANKIMVFGHSLGFLDRIYFDFLSKNASNNTEWVFYYFTEDDRKKAKEIADSLKIKKYKIKKSEEFWDKEKP